MSTQALHPTPRWQAVAREQFRAVGVAVRPEATLLTVLIATLSVLALVAIFRARQNPAHNPNLDLSPEMLIPAIFLAFLAPLSIWKSEEPSRRSYHWSMPVARSVHTLTKNTSGWVWFMIAMMAFILWGLLMALITGGDLGVERGQAIPAWRWIHPFVAATIAYLVGSTVVLASDHPWRWFAGIVLGFVLVTNILRAAGMPDLAMALQSVWEGNWGLEVALTGSTEVLTEVTRRDGTTMIRLIDRPDFHAWIRAALLWLGIGTAGVVAAAYRHQER
ncbi:hypothetical protein BH23GEM5_BH23GEM5_05120 [soil metagenome]